MLPDKKKFLESLSYRFPSIAKTGTEIINLTSILHLPKGTEHFISDVHGEYEQFNHIIKNCSGNVRAKIEEEFGFELSRDDKTELATLIYYPLEKLALLRESGCDMNDRYRTVLLRMVRMARYVSMKYTRSHVRKAIPDDFQYIIEELMTIKDVPDKSSYYDGIFDMIISTGQAEPCIHAFSHMIRQLTVAHLHLIGDIYDRGPGPHIIMDTLMKHHSLDIQWGNHDLIWLGAACGDPVCMATVVRITTRYANLDILENGYGINMVPLVRLAMDVYGDTDCSAFKIKYNPETYDESDLALDMQMHKAITIIQFKLEGQWIRRHPEFAMEDRLLLDKINYEDKTLCAYGNTYALKDTDFPTVNPNDPYALTDQEAAVVERLCSAFVGSEKLQKHMRFMLNNGSLYLVCNNNLLFHGCIPLGEDGAFKELTLEGKTYKGRALMDAFDNYVRRAYYSRSEEERSYARDILYYLWCGPDSPLFGKARMTTFERQFIADSASHEEPKAPYYALYNDEKVVYSIFDEFGLDHETSRIINGHVPVKKRKGESPLKCGGKLLIIDGGFSRAYQSTTGIAGYTLVYNSHGLKLVAHEPFTSTAEAIRKGSDIHSEGFLVEYMVKRKTVADTDTGKQLRDRIRDLTELLEAYRNGDIAEKE